MGAFCVFGVSKGICKKQAEKKVETFVFEVREGSDKKVRRELPIAEWAQKVAAETDRLFAETEKVGKISPEFDAPQFCHDWIAADPSHVRSTKIMVRGEKIDKNGDVVIRDGAPVMTWVEYAGQKNPQPALI